MDIDLNALITEQEPDEKNAITNGSPSTKRDYFDCLRKTPSRTHDMLDLGHIILDHDQVILSANTTICEMLGYPKEQIEGSRFADLIYKKFPLDLKNLRGKPFDIRFRNRHSFFWAKILTQDYFNPNNGELETRVTFRDITAQKLAEKELGWQLKVSTEMESILELMGRNTLDMKWISRRILTAAINLTQSKNGFIAKIHETDAHGLAMVMGEVYPQVGWAGQKTLFLHQDKNNFFMGLLGQSLNTLRPFFTTPPSGHPPLEGLPQDHIPIHGFLSVPMLMEKNPTGLIVLANPKNAYSQEHVKVVQRLSELYIIAERRHLAESEVIRLNRLKNGLAS
ncbi:MAG: GAF domain-containing protein [Desulfobacterales bacterium]|nr:GAF domain-containing protein [Desulfobacterales bacterium]